MKPQGARRAQRGGGRIGLICRPCVYMSLLLKIVGFYVARLRLRKMV